MKLIVPTANGMHVADQRLVRLASWLGIECRVVPFERDKAIACISSAGSEDPTSVLVINGEVIGQSLDENGLAALAEIVQSRFKRAIVYQVPDGARGDLVLRSLSLQRLHSLESARPSDTYDITSYLKEVCGSFSGLSFGSVDSARDRTMASTPSTDLDAIISIREKLLFARVRAGRNETFFFAGREISDISATVSDPSLSGHFSGLFPVLMFLRYSFMATCWKPQASSACLIVDDPPLWKRYGFMDYADLISLMDRHNFHTSIAFIPYYYRNSQSVVARMFLKRSDRLSLCYHGNDHTGAELGSSSIANLNGLLGTAVSRMETHRQKTEVPCDKIMVFPQGVFSREAMAALRARNFIAAVNTGYAPWQGDGSLCLEELLDPAVMRYHDFALFLRHYPSAINVAEIASNLFLGKPVVIVEHQDAFENPLALLASIEKVNRVLPGIQWTNLRVATESAFLWRGAEQNSFEVRAFSSSVRLTNSGDVPCTYTIFWRNTAGSTPEKIMTSDGRTVAPILKEGIIGGAVTVSAGQTLQIQVLYQNKLPVSTSNQKLKYMAKVIARRRLSELRDHYLSRHPAVLSFAKSAYKRLNASTASAGRQS